MDDLYEEILEELYDEIERATKDSQDYLKHGMNAEPTLAYIMGLSKSVKVIRDKKKEKITSGVAPVQLKGDEI